MESGMESGIIVGPPRTKADYPNDTGLSPDWVSPYVDVYVFGPKWSDPPALREKPLFFGSFLTSKGAEDFRRKYGDIAKTMSSDER